MLLPPHSHILEPVNYWETRVGSTRGKWLAAAVAVAFLCAGLLGWWLRERSLEPSRAKRPFRVSSHLLPPSQGVDNALINSSNEIFQEACHRRHVPIEIVPTDGDPLDDIVDHQIDLTQLVFDSPENRSKVYISEPWIVDSAWMVTRESSGITTPEQVVGRRVWCQDNARHKFLAAQNFPGARLEVQDSFITAVEGVCEGKADAALIEPVKADTRAFFQHLPACRDVKLSFNDLPEGRIWFGVGGHKDPATEAAVTAIREEIGRMAEDGTLARIYLNHGLDPNNAATILHYLTVLRERDRNMRIAIAILVLVLLALTWQGLHLRKARRLADQANTAKSEFLANMSHELRTPLNSVIGMTRLALETDASSERREFLTIASASAESLLSVVNEILDFSKLETGKLSMEELEIDLYELVESSTRLFALPAHQKKLELICEVSPACPQYIHGDPVRLRQVLFNLVGNAVKFTHKGEVKVRVEVILANQGPLLQFSVFDTGIGIAEDKLAVIFEPFSQADSSTTRKFGGTGLGLAITSRLVELMDGTIRVESSPQQGAAFHFTIPLRAVAGQLPIMPDEVLSGRALVVDDNATARSAVENLLRRWGLTVATAADAESALDALAQADRSGEHYSLLVIDSDMPAMDGFELASLVQSRFGLGHAIVMMLTSDKCNLTAARCRELGIVAHLIKPVGRSELLATARSVLRGSPLTSGVAEETQSRVLHRTPGRSWHILVAEDNAVNRKLTMTILQRAGHSVEIAENGREAVQLARATQFDVVLMDIQMPEMDGLEAARAIRHDESRTGSHVAMIAMTAHAMKGDIERCLAAGMDGYVAKPFQPRDFLETLEAVKVKVDQARAELSPSGSDD